MLGGSLPSVARSPLSPGGTELAALGRETPDSGLSGSARRWGSMFSRSERWIPGPSNHALVSHSPQLCRKLIFHELLEVSWGSGSICWNKQAASHHFIKTPLHIHKAPSSGSGQSQAS